MAKKKFGNKTVPQGFYNGCDEQFLNPDSPHDKVIIVEGKKFYVMAAKLGFHSEFFKLVFGYDDNDELTLTNTSANDFLLFLRCLNPAFSITNRNVAKLLLQEKKFCSPLIYNKCMDYLEALSNLKGFNLDELLDLTIEVQDEKLKSIIESELLKKFESKKSWTSGVENIQIAVNYDLMNLKGIVEMYFVDEFKRSPRAEKIGLLRLTSYHDCLEDLKNQFGGLLIDEFKVYPKHNTPLLLDTAEQYGLENLKTVIDNDLCQEFANTKKKTQKLYDKYLDFVKSYNLPRLQEYLDKFFLFILKKEPLNRIVRFLPTAKEYQLLEFLDYVEMLLCQRFVEVEDKSTLLIRYLEGSNKYSFRALKDTVEAWLLNEFSVTENIYPLTLAFEYHLETYKKEVARVYSERVPIGRLYQQSREIIKTFPKDIQKFLHDAVMKRIIFPKSN